MRPAVIIRFVWAGSSAAYTSAAGLGGSERGGSVESGERGSRHASGRCIPSWRPGSKVTGQGVILGSSSKGRRSTVWRGRRQTQTPQTQKLIEHETRSSAIGVRTGPWLLPVRFLTRGVRPNSRLHLARTSAQLLGCPRSGLDHRVSSCCPRRTALSL